MYENMTAESEQQNFIKFNDVLSRSRSFTISEDIPNRIYVSKENEESKRELRFALYWFSTNKL